MVGVLLERGASVHSTNHWGATPLLAATQSQNLTLVKMLVSHGASVNLVSDSPTSFTPLMAAVQSGNEGITAVLLNNSADQDVQMKGVWHLQSLLLIILLICVLVFQVVNSLLSCLLR